MVRYSDVDIENLIREPKPLMPNWKSQIQLRDTNRSSRHKDFEVQGRNGNNFKLILRQNIINELDFSIIMGVYPSDSNKLFHLKRYDGKSHEHYNPIEQERFYDFHIHIATERYQIFGNQECDKYAQPTDRFTTYQQAFNCVLEDCNFILPDNPQLELDLFNL